MAETFTPAVCGGSYRRTIAIALFAMGAVASAATLGFALGSIGARVPQRVSLGLALAVGVVAALRECGVVRIPVPAMRRQVPEAWRRERPLFVWSAGYGIVLGFGVGTYLPTGTFWAACAGVVAVGNGATGAVCLAAFGLGRGLMVVGAGDNPIPRLGRLHVLVRPANVVAVVLCTVLLMPAAAAAATPTGLSEPSVSGSVIAYTDRTSGIANVVVLVAGETPIVFPNGHTPALNGRRLAYVDDAGIRVVDWRTGTEIFRQAGLVAKPSLSGQRLAYVKRSGTRHRLEVRNLTTLRATLVSAVGAGVDMGRPSLVGMNIAWHESAGQVHRIFRRSLSTGVTRIIASGGRGTDYINPVMTTTHIAWIRSAGERADVLIQKIGAPRTTRRVALIRGPKYVPGTMAITPGTLWVTRWTTATNNAVILKYGWAR